MHFPEKKSPDQSQMNQSKKLKSKVNLAISPRKVDPSPPNMNVHLHNIQRKPEKMISPQTSRINPNLRPSPSHYQINKPLQEYGSSIRQFESPPPRP